MVSWVKLSGPSGSGKSTICKVLAYDINGIVPSLSSAERDLLKRHSKLLSSLLSKFKSSKCIYVGPRMAPSRHFSIPKKTHDLFSNIQMPQCFDKAVSQGERQRYVFLEAISTGADFFILDECLSGVSEQHEFQILSKIYYSTPRPACLYVSHRKNVSLNTFFDMKAEL